MKVSLIIFFLLGLLPSLVRAERLLPFRERWSFSPVQEIREDDRVIHRKLFKRIMLLEKHDLPVIETSFTYVKNKSDTSDISQVAASLKASFDKRAKIKRVKKDHLVVEGKATKINRHFQFEILRRGDEVIIISSLIRSGFWKGMRSEVDELHHLLTKYTLEEKRTSWQRNVLNRFSPTPTAEANDVMSELLTIIRTSNDVRDAVNSAATTTNSQLGSLNDNLSEINTQIGAGNQNWSNTNTQIGAGIQNWANSNKQMAIGNQNWADSNKQIAIGNQNWANTNTELGKFNSNWAESNKLFAKLVDPQHMGKVAMYTAAGAALGSVAVSLAVQGVSTGLAYLHELITGKEKKKLEWREFELAMENWDTKMNDIVALETKLDEFLGAFAFFEEKGFSNNFVKDLERAIKDMSFNSKELKAFSGDKTNEQECRMIAHDAAFELDAKLKDYENILQYVGKNKMAITGGLDYFCTQLKDLKRKLIALEQQLQDMRLMILNAENQFYEKERKGLEKREDRIASINDKTNRTRKEQHKYDQAVQGGAIVVAEDQKATWVEACMDGKNPAGVEVNKAFESVIQRTINHFKRKQLCSERYVPVAEVGRDEKAQETLAAEDKLREQLILGTNSYVDIKLSQEQMSWMARLRADAYCFQFAHKDSSTAPKLCTEYPEVLHSLTLSKNYDKADKAYNEKCSEKYLGAIKSLGKQDN